MRVLSKLLIAFGGAAVAGGAGFLAFSQAAKQKKAIEEALASGGAFKAHVTGYWPFTATEAERKMEGGLKDRKGKPLHTLEMHQKDPVAHPYVSVSGDHTIFPYGQLILIDEWPGLKFRVTDTGGHFFGVNKVYRVTGEEPLDVCVDSKATKVIPHATVTIVKGDHFDKAGKDVAVSKIKDQTVAGALFMLGAKRG